MPHKGSKKTDENKAVDMSEHLVESLKSVQESISRMNNSIQNLTDQVAGMRVEIDSVKDLKTSLEHTQSQLDQTKNDVETINDKVTNLVEMCIKGKYTVMILFCNNVICSMLIGPMRLICSVLSSARF